MGKRVVKIRVGPFAGFQARIAGLIGLLLGCIYSFGGLLIDALVSWGILSPVAMGTPGISHGTLLAFGALVGMPLLAAGFGFLAGMVGGILYNILAKRFGAIKADFFVYDTPLVKE